MAKSEGTDPAVTGDAAASAETPASTVTTARKTEIRHRVTINADQGPGGTSPILINVNGKADLLQRDVELLLTDAQLENLRNAEVRGYSAEIDGRNVTVPGRKRFSFVVNGTVEVDPATLDTSPEVASDGDATA